MEPSGIPVPDFLAGLTARRRGEAERLIDILRDMTGEPPVMWGPSIIGFGSTTYTLESGRSGQMGEVGFSPRKAALTIYVPEGFDRYGELLDQLGPHKTSVSCLYITSLDKVDEGVLTQILAATFAHHHGSASTSTSVPAKEPATVEEYVASVPSAARPVFDRLRSLIQATIPEATEDVTYKMIGYRTVPGKRARVFISGWKDHVGMYPVPKDEVLENKLVPFRKGKGTLWFQLDEELPEDLIREVVLALV